MRAVCAPSIAPQTVKFLHKRHGRAHEEDLCRVNNRFRGPWVKCQLATSELRAGLHGTEGLQGRLANACKDGRLDKALEALLQMEKQGFVPAVQTYCNLLQICVEKRAVAEVRQVRAHVAKNGLESHLFLGESLVNALVKCGSLADALEIFCRLPQRTVFSWTAVMTGYMQGGQAREALRLFGQMQAACVQPNKYTFVTLLRACGSLADLEEGQRIHAEAVKHRCEQDLFVATTLLDMYARCGSMTNARLVFDRLPRPDVASWTAIIAGYVLSEQGEVAFDMYEKMQEEGVRPNDRTLVRVLQACCILEDSEEHSLEEGATVRARMLQRGRAIHAQAAWMRCESDIFVGSILVHMYVTSGSLLDAMHVFERLSQRDVVTWSAMIAGYAQFAEGEKALQLYRLMQEEGVRPNGRTFVSALQACGSLAEMQGEGPHIKASALCKGKAIHAEAAWSRDEADVFVGSALVHMYARCGSILDAQHVFDALPERDVVAWTAMISACAEQGAGEQALQTYSQMQAAGVPPNETTFLCILKACSDIGALNICHEVYHHIQAHQGSKKWTLVGNALIHAYGKCGSMVHSEQVFNWMPRQDVYAWTAVIAGYARQGNSEASLHFFQKMQLAGVKPNGVTFLSLLSACSHSGLIDRALGYFQSMTSNHGIQATIQHYAIIIDSLCRVGLLSKAQDLLQEMPQQPDLALWSSVLAACRQHGNLELGRRAFDSLVLLAPHDGAAYVVMSNIYADAGMWDLSMEIDELRRNADAWKQPGQSWIEHEDEVHMFMSEDQRHDQSNQIYNSLNDFHSQQTEGYTRA